MNGVPTSGMPGKAPMNGVLLRQIPVFLAVIPLAIACSDTSTAPISDAELSVETDLALGTAQAVAAGEVLESVTGSAHLLSPRDGYWRTISFHGIQDVNLDVKGRFHWRVHNRGGGSKVSGRIVCLAVEGDQAWLAGVFEKAQNPNNIGKWASFWVVDNGEGMDAPPDQLSLQWRGVASPENDPQGFCDQKPTDGDLLSIEAGNIQIH